VIYIKSNATIFNIATFKSSKHLISNQVLHQHCIDRLNNIIIKSTAEVLNTIGGRGYGVPEMTAAGF